MNSSILFLDNTDFSTHKSQHLLFSNGDYSLRLYFDFRLINENIFYVLSEGQLYRASLSNSSFVELGLNGSTILNNCTLAIESKAGIIQSLLFYKHGSKTELLIAVSLQKLAYTLSSKKLHANNDPNTNGAEVNDADCKIITYSLADVDSYTESKNYLSQTKQAVMNTEIEFKNELGHRLDLGDLNNDSLLIDFHIQDCKDNSATNSNLTLNTNQDSSLLTISEDIQSISSQKEDLIELRRFENLTRMANNLNSRWRLNKVSNDVLI